MRLLGPLLQLVPRSRHVPAPLPARTIIFLHIPKTGGISLRETLLHETRPCPSFRIIHPIDDQARLAALPPEHRSHLGLVEGHLYYGVHELIPGPYAYVTMLRDPVARVVSYYNFVRQSKSHHLHERIVTEGLSLPECLRLRLTIELDNFMTRALTSLDRVGVGFGKVTQAMLEDAKAHLESIAVVGLTERFQESLDRMAAAFGWRAHVAPRLNTSTRGPSINDIDEATRRNIQERNAFDIELYAHAQRLFDRYQPARIGLD